MLYSGGSGPVVTPNLFATQFFYKAERNDGKDIPQAADWLLRLLVTRDANGFFKAAIWGASIDQGFEPVDGSRVQPFEALPDTHMKRRILERARRCYDNSAWLAHNYFDAPKLAFVREVPGFPYIRTDGASFQKISELQYEARDLWLFLEAASVGHPLAIACWFEYADEDLDVNGWDNQLAWLLPEIPPRVACYTPLCVAAVQDQLRRYAALPEELRSRLLRSMERFTLSQCRRNVVDRILDLALAFEIAVSGPGRDNAPMGWKVSVRAAQIIGGPLNLRQANRTVINKLYSFRNKATHGSDLSSKDDREMQDTVQSSLAVYQDLISSVLSLGQQPDWPSLELEPRGP
jgi:hypothetical protein